MPLLVKDNQLILEDTSLRHQRAKVLTNLYRNNKVLFAEYVLFHKGLLIGYDREKLKVKRILFLTQHVKKKTTFQISGLLIHRSQHMRKSTLIRRIMRGIQMHFIGM